MNTIKVLVVEDDDRVRYVQIKALKKANIDAYEACCAREALEILHSHRDIHYIIIDIGLSDINGIASLTNTAHSLGISRSSLQRKIEKYQIR